jgi:hypothetical protein
MSKEDISPIIREGIRIMTQVNEGLEIEVVGVNITLLVN